MQPDFVFLAACHFQRCGYVPSSQDDLTRHINESHGIVNGKRWCECCGVHARSSHFKAPKHLRNESVAEGFLDLSSIT